MSEIDKDLQEQINLIRADAESIEVSENVSFDNIMKQLPDNRIASCKKRSRGRKIVIGLAGVAAIFLAIMYFPKYTNNFIYKYGEMLQRDVGDGVNRLSSYSELSKYILATSTKKSEGSESKHMSNTGSSSVSYSSTNVRTEGVEEGDAAKTDGEYVYYCSVFYDDIYQHENLYLIIAKADGENSKKVSEIHIGGEISKRLKKYKIQSLGYGTYNSIELILNGDELIVIASPDITEIEEDENGRPWQFIGNSSEDTLIFIYDVSDKTSPRLKDTLMLDGQYESCRMVDGYLYIFTEKYIRYNKNKLIWGETGAANEYGPKVNGKPIATDDVYVMDCAYYRQYNIMASIDLDDTSKYCEAIAVLSDGQSVAQYVSENNIYMLINKRYEYLEYVDNGKEEMFVEYEHQGEIVRFSYKDGKIELNGNVDIKGNLGDSFDIDEYNGYLRLAVTTGYSQNCYEKVSVKYYDGFKWVESNEWLIHNCRNIVTIGDSSLYVFDDDLNMVGKFEQMAIGQSVHSARFMGDMAYISTKNQTISVDLSIPTNPKVINKLPMLGSASYLHNVDGQTLLGIGRDENYDMKISLYDVSDKNIIEEVDSYVLQDVSTDAKYKEYMFYDEMSLFAVRTSGDFFYEDIELGHSNKGEYYRVFLYADDKVREVLKCPVYEFFDDNLVRGFYIDGYIYVVTPRNAMRVYNTTDYSFVAQTDR